MEIPYRLKCWLAHIPHHGENVSGTCRVLATLQSRTKLSNGLEQVEVVAAYVVLRQIDDRGHERHLTVMVGGVLGHRPGQLGHLDLPLVVTLQTGEQHLLTDKRSLQGTNEVPKTVLKNCIIRNNCKKMVIWSP